MNNFGSPSTERRREPPKITEPPRKEVEGRQKEGGKSDIREDLDPFEAGEEDDHIVEIGKEDDDEQRDQGKEKEKEKDKGKEKKKAPEEAKNASALELLSAKAEEEKKKREEQRNTF